MNKITRSGAAVVLLLLTCSMLFAQEKITNYYGTPEQLSFDKALYNLSWSSHPNEIYYKHEYIPKGEIPEHFNNMILLDFVQTDMSVEQAAKAQEKKLIERKKTDASCNYQMIVSPDGKEIVLDFLMSQAKGDAVNLLEWSAYRYKAYTDKAGHRGILLFGICRRAYDDKVKNFLSTLAVTRGEGINHLIAYKIPEIQLK